MFATYKQVGLLTDENQLRINILGDKVFICSSIYNGFQVYRYDNLSVCMISRKIPNCKIQAFDVSGHETYIGSENKIIVFERAKVVRVYDIGQNIICQLLIGNILLVSDSDRRLSIVDIKLKRIIGRMQLLQDSDCTIIIHPSTYINKVLLGFSNGHIELWNFNTKKLIYRFTAHISFKKSVATGINVIIQSPYPDVVAIGYMSGHILFLNLKSDRIVLSCNQGTEPVLGISFRSDHRSNQIRFASSNTTGKVNIWTINLNVKEKKSTLVEHSGEFIAHKEKLTTIQFMEGEPILLTSSTDNSIKQWIFDSSDSSPRLLKSIVGHDGPPTKMKFLETMTNLTGRGHADSTSCDVIHSGSDGVLRFSNIISDLKNREFSTKNLIKHNHFQKALPPILDFDFSTFKDKNWGDIVTIHKSHSYAYIWRSDHQAITDKVLVQPNTSFHTYNVPFTLEDHATSISVSACGNFAVVGYRSGIIYKYNLQSTIERGSFPTVSPSIVVHHKEVNGLFIDISNREMISSGVDGKVVFWDFMNHSVLLVIESEIPWILLRGCRETGFVALANLHHDIQIYDIYTRKIIRVFNGGHSRFISDLVFTPDSRRLISSSLDTTMRVWDMPSGRCVAWLSFSSGITSLAISPTSEYLCVGLYNKVGFAVFIDRSLYENIYINEEPSSPVPMNSIPSKNFSKISNQAIHSENVKSKLLDDGNTLISLSSMPRIYCTNLFYLEAIRLRNTAQTSKLIKMEIPFFLSDLGKSRNEVSVSKGLTAQSSEQQQSSSEMRGIKQSRILKGQQTHKGISLASYILANHVAVARNISPNFDSILAYLVTLPPSSVDLEIRQLCSNPDSLNLELLSSFLYIIHYLLSKKKNFEILQAILFRTLSHYEELLVTRKEFSHVVHSIASDLHTTSQKFRLLVEVNLCLLRLVTGSF